MVPSPATRFQSARGVRTVEMDASIGGGAYPKLPSSVPAPALDSGVVLRRADVNIAKDRVAGRFSLIVDDIGA